MTGGGHNSAGGDMRTQCLHYHGYNLGRVQNVTPLLYIKLNYIWFKDSPMIGFMRYDDVPKTKCGVDIDDGKDLHVLPSLLCPDIQGKL